MRDKGWTFGVCVTPPLDHHQGHAAHDGLRCRSGAPPCARSAARPVGLVKPLGDHAFDARGAVVDHPQLGGRQPYPPATESGCRLRRPQHNSRGRGRRPVQVRDEFSVDPHPPCSQVLLDPLPSQPGGDEPVEHCRDVGALIGHQVIMHRRTDSTGRIARHSDTRSAQQPLSPDGPRLGPQARVTSLPSLSDWPRGARWHSS